MSFYNVGILEEDLPFVRNLAEKEGCTLEQAVSSLVHRAVEEEKERLLGGCPHCHAIEGPHKENCAVKDAVERRLVRGFPTYDVAGDGTGEIRSLKYDPPHTMATRTIGASPYPVASLSRGGKQFTVSVHKVVCEAFHGPQPFPKAVVSHEPDPNPLNIHPDNLKWASSRRNGEQRRFRRGRPKKSS